MSDADSRVRGRIDQLLECLEALLAPGNPYYLALLRETALDGNLGKGAT